MRTLHFQKFTTSSGDESSIIVALKWSRNHKRRDPTTKKRAKPTIIEALSAISRCDSSNLLREELPFDNGAQPSPNPSALTGHLTSGSCGGPV
jgi:hypothetical protein